MNEPIKIRLYIFDVLYDSLKHRYNYGALKQGNNIISDIDEATIGAHGLLAPCFGPSHVRCTMVEDFLIPDFLGVVILLSLIVLAIIVCDELYTKNYIKGNLGADIGIIPLFHEKRYHGF